ncbi:metG [Symbiodinium sp. CCMP2592]|nr:metG [Symbiodinium sp. CCMP2592]
MPPKAPTVGSLRTEKGLAELNELLSSRSYVGGTIFATAEDMTFFAQVPSRPDRQKYPHLLRWYNHIAGLRARHAPYHVWPGQTKTSQDSEPAGQETKKGPRAPGKEKQVLPFDCKVEPVEDRRQVQGDDSVKRGAGGKCFPSAEKGPHGRYYITTAINYCNGWPHIGHAYEALTSDVFARYHRLLGQDVFFMTGADEHGQKIAQAAENEGLQPQEICDRYCLGFRALNQRLNVSNDFYVRTTADRHKVVARSVWDICKKKGDIYLDRYEGWYMVREERFITDQEAQEFNFKDPTSGAPLKKMSEPSFFFRLSKYQEKVIKLIEDRPEFIQPAQYRGEILERLKSIEAPGALIAAVWSVTANNKTVEPPASGRQRILIVGAGVTGSMLALLAKDMGLSVRVLEKSRGAGGRMATYGYRHGDRSSPLLAQADLGAQYITTRSSPDHPVLGPLYKRLLDAGVLKPFTAEIAGPNPYGAASSDVRHFTAPNGLKSVSQYLLESSGVPVDWGVAVDDLTLSETGEVSVSVKEGSLPADAAAASVVVLTQPPPQVLGASKFGMRGSFLQHTPETISTSLKKVEYSSRFAVAYFFDKSKVTWPFTWTCQYFDKGDVRYVAHDSAKRHSTHETMISVLVHSGVPLGIELQDEEDPFPTAAARLQRDLEAKLPELPWAGAEGSKVHKWKYSQVYKGFGGARLAPDWAWPVEEAKEAAPGCVPLFRTDKSLGLLCGDAMAPAGNFEGVASLQSVVQVDVQILRGSMNKAACESKECFVSCPEDLVDGKRHVMYVWFDALINYLSGIDGIDPKKPLSRFWPANMHIVGKDIHWFHTVIWPAMLMSSGIPLPKSVVVHGFIAGADGRKMSKSLGNVVDPHDMLDKFPCDTLRWYFCREAAFGDDVRFSEDSLRLMHNAELCDNLGNLVNRAVNLSGGSVPRCDVEVSLPFDLKELKASVSEAFEAYRLSDAADFTVRAAAATNKWIADLEPWKMKAEDQKARRSACLRKLLEAGPALAAVSVWPADPMVFQLDLIRDECIPGQAVYVLAHFFAPFIPVAAEVLPSCSKTAQENSKARLLESTPVEAIFAKVGQPPRQRDPVGEIRADLAVSPLRHRPIPELRDDFANLEDGKEAPKLRSATASPELKLLAFLVQVKATSLLFEQLEVKKVDVDAATEKKAEAKAKADSKKK